MMREQVLSLLIHGINHGVLIALVALGFAVIFNLLRTLDFNHTDRLTLGAYSFIALYPCFGYVGACLLSCCICMGWAVAIEELLYRRVRHKGGTAILLLSVGVSIITQSGLALAYGSSLRTSVAPDPIVEVLSFRFYIRELVLLLALPAFYVLLLGLSRSHVGRQIRAVSSNYERAVVLQLPVRRLVGGAFALSGLLAALGGVSVAVSTGIHPYAGFKYLIFAFTACVVGGLGNVVGAGISGLVLGIVLVFTETYTSSLAAEALSIGVMVAVLCCRPKGLFPSKSRAF